MLTTTVPPPTVRFHATFAMWAGAFALGAVLLALAIRNQFDLLCALVLTGALLLISLRDKGMTCLLTLAYLILMGDIRRVVSLFAGQPSLDYLLLIGPTMAAVLAIPLLLKVRLRDSLSKGMLLLLVIMILEVFNPKQGGLAIGLSGVIFYIAPVLWFWIGRRYASPRTVEHLLLFVLFPLAVAAAVLGFVQVFIGFLPWEQAWIDVAAKTYTALHVGGSIRAFGFSVSAAEYVGLMGIGSVSIAAMFFTGRRAWVLALPLLIAGIVLASGRTAILKLVVAFACAWALRKQGRVKPAAIVRLVVLAGLGLFSVGFVASHFAPDPGGDSQKRSSVQSALAHQAGGLSHPLDQRYSTAGVHGDMIVSAIEQGFIYPLGHGLGSTTLASTKFGGDASTGTSEIDFGDSFISLGMLGGGLYLVLVILVFQKAFAYLHVVKRSISLSVLIILIFTVGAWLIGGQYSTSSVLFFLIGGLVCKPASGKQRWAEN